MQRRPFLFNALTLPTVWSTRLGTGLALGAAAPLAQAQPAARAARTAPTQAPAPAFRAPPAAVWQSLEDSVRGRLGVAVLAPSLGTVWGHRLDEAFPMCSCFKWLLATRVLQRVDAGQERLDRRLRFGREQLVPNSPVTSRRVGGRGMSLAELCEATVTTSDNTAANLLLPQVGGAAALTALARALGDQATRLDRPEPALNEARPGDLRDTTSPRGMATSLQAAALGSALSASSREQLRAWLMATQTGSRRLRAGLPAGWRLGHKTGTGEQGSTNDVAVCWPPQGEPLIITSFLTQSAAPFEAREAVLAEVARQVAAAFTAAAA